MAIIVKPITGCNLGCEYCFEGLQRDVGNFTSRKDYDLGAILDSVQRLHDETGMVPVVHGGEPLLLPKLDLETLLGKLSAFGKPTSIQTNGLTIDDDHIRLFQEHNTTVGLSLDGPWPINRGRSAGSVAHTKKTTERIILNLRKLLDAGVPVGVISIISKLHVEDGATEQFQQWCAQLVEWGIQGGRFNLVQVDDPSLRERFELSVEEATSFYLSMAEWAIDFTTTRWAPFHEIVENLLGFPLAGCVWDACDIWKSDGVVEILAHGEIANCAKISSDGIPHLADQISSMARVDQLQQVPHAFGGCLGCDYWSVCHGQCPAESLDGDWRNKSRYCEMWYALYEYFATTLRRALPDVELVIDAPENERLARRGEFRALRKVSVDDLSASWVPWSHRARDEVAREPRSRHTVWNIGLFQ